MTITEGYGGKPTHIRISPRDRDKTALTPEKRIAELWIEQKGAVEWLLGASLEPAKTGKKYKDYTVVQDEKGNRFVQGEKITKYEGRETLAYITLDELLALRDECNDAIQELVK